MKQQQCEVFFPLLLTMSNDGLIDVGILQALQLSKVPSLVGKVVALQILR
jgi:hypothetical protein